MTIRSSPNNSAVAALDDLRLKITVAAECANRSPTDITLIAVSKTRDAVDIRPVLEAGQRIFGENRVQEAQQKWPPLKAQFPDVELHLIGPLQSNKVKDAVELFDAIHTLDRPKIARAIAQELAKKITNYVCSFRSTLARNHKRPVFFQKISASFISSAQMSSIWISPASCASRLWTTSPPSISHF